MTIGIGDSIATLSLCGCLLLAMLLPPALRGQDWSALPGAPVASRHNDAFFATPDVGWIVNGSGEIWKTTDGGSSWDRQLLSSSSHFRSVGFVDDQRGFAGNVGDGEFGSTDRRALYETSDGGETWSGVSIWHGPTPKGLCGMHVVNDSTVVAVGRVRGPAFFIRTTDGGNIWRTKDMSDFAAGLIDVHFFSPDSGYAVGLTNVDHDKSRGVVLFTADGGDTWTNRFTTSRQGEWNWKITFPSRSVGYASLQRNSLSPIYFLKTSDGGETWEEKLFSESYYFVQGIGFVDEATGWIGGNSSNPMFVTRNGGDTWSPAENFNRVNRFRFLGDSLAYAVGRSVYKFDQRVAVGAEPNDNDGPVSYAIFDQSNYPDPFSDETTIQFSLSEPSFTTISIYDVAGRAVTMLVAQWLSSGQHRFVWDGRTSDRTPAADGVYVYAIDSGGQRSTGELILLR